VDDVIVGIGFTPFRPRLPGPGSQHRSKLLTQVVLETRLKSESLEPLIALLVFVVQKSRPKKQTN